MPQPRQIIQIATCCAGHPGHPHVHHINLALCNDGTLWACVDVNIGNWFQVDVSEILGG